ncbi:MAG: hypothetical protein EZS28_032640 [Streblomastix strix]|uniref:Uncharacterized protein n=1 Tax=Streblomastix strix TaxID=222440 RepID=A0A5J4UNU4_9EUKA|nr:MAG: hypothetical protein EZS28_032640 [Streblomastix strix]
MQPQQHLNVQTVSTVVNGDVNVKNWNFDFELAVAEACMDYIRSRHPITDIVYNNHQVEANIESDVLNLVRDLELDQFCLKRSILSGRGQIVGHLYGSTRQQEVQQQFQCKAS